VELFFKIKQHLRVDTNQFSGKKQIKNSDEIPFHHLRQLDKYTKWMPSHPSTLHNIGMPTNQILQLLTKQGKKLDTEIAKTIGLTVDMTRSYLLGRNDRRWQDNVLPYYSV